MKIIVALILIFMTGQSWALTIRSKPHSAATYSQALLFSLYTESTNDYERQWKMAVKTSNGSTEYLRNFLRPSVEFSVDYNVATSQDVASSVFKIGCSDSAHSSCDTPFAQILIGGTKNEVLETTKKIENCLMGFKMEIYSHVHITQVTSVMYEVVCKTKWDRGY